MLRATPAGAVRELLSSVNYVDSEETVSVIVTVDTSIALLGLGRSIHQGDYGTNVGGSYRS